MTLLHNITCWLIKTHDSKATRSNRWEQQRSKAKNNSLNEKLKYEDFSGLTCQILYTCSLKSPLSTHT